MGRTPFLLIFQNPKLMSSARAFPASFIAPMQARGRAEIPAGIWRCEMKFDGYRAIAVLNWGRADLWSRNQLPLSADYPEIVRALRETELPGITLAVAQNGQLVATRGYGKQGDLPIEPTLPAMLPSCVGWPGVWPTSRWFWPLKPRPNPRLRGQRAGVRGGRGRCLSPWRRDSWRWRVSWW